jgi:glutamyl-tRNA synthetase
MNWLDPKTGDLTRGFRELGFLPQAFVNMLAMLGWNDGTDQELYTTEELIERFSIERINKSGAKFDFEKAKWFNAEWIKLISAERLEEAITNILKEKGIQSQDTTHLEKIIHLVKDRLTFINDFWDQASFFFITPETYDLNAVKPKWNEQKETFFKSLISSISALETFQSVDLELIFKSLAETQGLKVGELMLPFRIMLVGGKFGPQVFDIASLLGKEVTINRIKKALEIFQ